MKERHKECDFCDDIKDAILLMEKVVRADHQSMSDPLAEANNAIATMQAAAQDAIVLLRPLVFEMKAERSEGDTPIGKSLLLEHRRQDD